jgi:hypothetical protein
MGIKREPILLGVCLIRLVPFVVDLLIGRREYESIFLVLL